MNALLIALITSAIMAPGNGTGLVFHERDTGAIITELGYFTPAQQACMVLGDPASFINAQCGRP